MHSAWFIGEAAAVYQTEVKLSGKQCSFYSFGLFTVRLWWRLTCEVWHHASGQPFCALHQWGHWSPNDFLGVHSRPPSLQPTGSHPQPCARLARHGQLNAWLASLLIVLNQEMWGIKMQQVSSCMPNGLLFVRQSDEAKWKKPPVLYTLAYRGFLLGNDGYFVFKMITYSADTNISSCAI